MTTQAEPDSAMAAVTESFNAAATSYERRVGGVTRSLGEQIIPIILKESTPTVPNPKILDNACGTGIITSLLLPHFPTAQITAADNSAGMIDVVKANGWKNVEAEILDGTNLETLRDDCFDISVTSLGIFFFPDPVKGAKEIFRTLKKGGVAVLTCWEYVGVIPIILEAQGVMEPKLGKLWEGVPTLRRWREPEMMVETLKQGGFGEVKMRECECVFSGEDEGALFESLIEFMGTLGIRECWTGEEMGRFEGAVGEVLGRARREGRKWLMPGGEGIRWVAWIAVARK